MKRNLQDITPISTSHGVGLKRVLLSSNESGCSLTQIAVTELKAGDVAVAHVHPDMQEGFYVLDGELQATLDGEKTLCQKDTFVYVEKCTSHEMQALTDCRIMTIGCVIEASRNKLYPMLFKQNKKTLVWGTEDWVISAIPNSESEVENGTWARYNLSEVISRRPTEILGKQTAHKYHNQLPLLAKIIDAHQDLSIQVHPGDAMALREHGKYGKSEMWYILDADPGSYLYAGFKEHITPEEFHQLIAESSNVKESKEGKESNPLNHSNHLNPSEPQNRQITDVLARHEVHKGDVFYLPAGRVHAICGGIKLAEIQQSSDVTYRIYDYNRPGLDGRPRELHTALAAQAIDYTVYPEYKTESRIESNTTSELLDTPYFSINLVETPFTLRRNMLKYDSFIILINLQSDCKIQIHATHDEILLAQGASCLIPAAIADYDIIPTTYTPDGMILPTKVMEAFINNYRSLGRKISDFFHLS